MAQKPMLREEVYARALGGLWPSRRGRHGM